jgi:hypothetical protein
METHQAFEMTRELGMNPEYEMTTEFGIQKKYDFIHFENTVQCERHIINNKNLIVAYKCCGGTGIAIARKNGGYKTKPVWPFIPIEGTCDICFAEDVSLYNTCKTCSHPFCKPCLDKITTKVCPYCRGKLNNNAWS